MSLPSERRGATVGREPAIPGFQAVQRFWDSGTQHWTARVLPGEFYITRSNEAIVTVLGSCIAACIGDPQLGIGGMNHFMLPEEVGGTAASDRWLDPAAGLATRYGTHAMETLINELLKLGASRPHLQIKLFGAGRILASITDVGARNIEFVRKYLQTEGLTAAAEDLGNIFPRRIVYFPATGKVRVRRLPPMAGTAIAERERRYLGNIAQRGVGGDVELFE